MSEFFVRKQYRRAGIGRDAATLIFDRFAGDWEIVEYHAPSRLGGILAPRGRRATVRGAIRKASRNGEVQQRFTSRPSASKK